MSIRFYFEESKLKNTKGHVAKVETKDIINREQLIERMANKKERFCPSIITGVIDLLEETIIDCLREGHAVNINNFIKFQSSIKGLFPEGRSSKEIDKRQVRATASISKRFNQTFQEDIGLTRFVKDVRKPIITAVSDGANDHNLKSLTIGKILYLKGKELNFDPAMSDEGIFLENRRLGQAIKISDEDTKAGESNIGFYIGELPWESGEELHLRLCKRFNGGPLRECLRGPFVLKRKRAPEAYKI